MRRPSERVYRAALAVVLVLGGGVVGYGVSEIGTSQCAVGFNLADGLFKDYENVSYSVVLMSTRGQSEYEGHEADANRLWDDIDAARAEYRNAKASCLGAER